MSLFQRGPLYSGFSLHRKACKWRGAIQFEVHFAWAYSADNLNIVGRGKSRAPYHRFAIIEIAALTYKNTEEWVAKQAET